MFASEDVLLTIAIPTYNRSKILNEALKKIIPQIKESKYRVELIVSDNCSPDDTKDIVEKNNTCNDIRYIRNEKNLGMDGNFVQCFKLARGKYVWVLGDDDHLVPNSLDLILDELSKNTEFGLIHLHNEPTKENVIIYTKCNEFISDISFWITFITENIVNTKYVKEIDFDKYMGTFFTLIPLYFIGAYKEKQNLWMNYKVFEGAKDINSNGSYNYFKVFTKNYLSIWKEYRKRLGITNRQYELEKRRLFFGHLRGFTVDILVRNKFPNMDKSKAFGYLFLYYWYEPYFYRFILSYIYHYKLRKNYDN